MDFKSSLGFGFFNRSKAKNRKHSERQLADMYNKVAIRGSIQHVWGDEMPTDEHSRSRMHSRQRNRKREDKSKSLPTVAMDMDRADQVELRPCETAPAVMPETHIRSAPIKINVNSHIVAPDSDEGESVDLAPPLLAMQALPTQVTPVRHPVEIRRRSSGAEGDSSLDQVVAGRSTTSLRSISPSIRSSYNESINLSHCIHKKFSFCPSTISLVSPLANKNSLRIPRALSTSNIQYPNSINKTGILSSSTTSLPYRVTSSNYQRGNISDDLVSMADDEEEDVTGVHSLSPSNSGHYSIISRMSSIPDTKNEHEYLPGQIYASIPPDALRGIDASVPTNQEHYQEDDESDSDSIAGLSEVNARGSDSDFSDAEQQPNYTITSHPQITADINAGLRRNSAKRVSYTRLDSGEYHAVVQRRSRTHLRDTSGSSTSEAGRTTGDQSDLSIPRDMNGELLSPGVTDLGRARSIASLWSIDHEYISGGI